MLRSQQRVEASLRQSLQRQRPVFVLSSSPGKTKRVRLMVRGLYHSHSYRYQLMAKIQQHLPMVKSLSANPQTGSILLTFHHPLSLDFVVSQVQAAVFSLVYQRITGTPYVSEAANNHWHELPENEVLTRLESSRQAGLTTHQVSQRKRFYGNNTLHTSLEGDGFIPTLVRQFTPLPVMLLLGAGCISVLTGSFLDGGIILGVVGINAVIGYVTDEKAQRTLRSLEQRPQGSAIVLRDGKRFKLAAEELVPGDIISIQPGLVPADARILHAQNLFADEALLTGESLPQEKHATILQEQNTPLRRRSNMLFMGSEVTSGAGLAVVTSIGIATEIGQIKRLAEQNEKPETALQRDLRVLTRDMVWTSVAVCGAIVGVGLLRGAQFSGLMRSAVALAIAAVPEGLPAVGTTTLAFGVSKLRQSNIYARNLRSIEALGTVQTICLDKTGTITWNQMVVEELYAGKIHWQRHDEKSEQVVSPLLLEVLALCNSVIVGTDENPEQIIGSGTEKALVDLAREQGINLEECKRLNPTQHVEQRTSTRPAMISRHNRLNNGKVFIACKGNPLYVLSTCNRWLNTHYVNGELVHQEEELTPEDLQEFRRQNQTLAQAALRVLGVAYKENDSEEFVWLGLVGLKDPPRPGMGELIGKFNRAGIRTVMLTGDQQETAQAIARDINLNSDQVYCETSPGQKLTIVKSLQRVDHKVAMVGDGINDAPALKAADLGISLIRNAANAAKECADLVVDDLEVENIHRAIIYGRTVRHNLRQSIAYLCATNISEILAMLGGHVSGLGAPLLPLQLLWINLMTDIFPSLALALAPPEKDLMALAPNKVGLPLLTKEDQLQLFKQGAVISCSALVPFAYYQIRFGNVARSSTAAFFSLSSSQLLHSFSQGGGNGKVGLAFAGGMVLLLAGIYVPFLRASLGTTLLGIKDIAMLSPIVGLTYVANKAIKTSNDTMQGGMQ